MSPVRSGVIAILAGIALFACSSGPAPVEDRNARTSRDVRPAAQGMHRVQQGDTLYSIAFRYGLDWKDVAAWNDVARPYTIYPGQDLRLTATSRQANAQTAITTRPAGKPPAATTRPVDTGASKTTSTAPSQPPASEPRSGTSTTVTSTRTPTPAPSTPADSRPAQPPAGPLKTPDRWLWPTEGRLLSRFSTGDASRKGIDIGGQEGQAVIASAAGEVVYSGSGLIGFGELIIIKHSDSMLTAYAHNKRRLVQEGDRVAAGGNIAEMGKNDQEQTMLHFELRIDGKPVDPLKYLPPR